MGQKKPTFLGIRAGSSFPYGPYSKKNLDEGSFTLTGINITAEGAWFFLSKLGIGGSAGVNWHPVDVGVLGWEKVQSDPFLSDVYIRSEPYLIVTIMTGAYSQIPIRGKFHATGKALGGIFLGKTPYQLYKPEYFMTGPDYFEITSAIDWNISWQAGAGIRYDITPCYVLVFDAEIFYNRLGFSFNSGSGSYTNYRIISFVNTTLGIRFNL
ncbi:MAG: hypothetical protein FJY07_10665 [Bacteroidetes bacterium]|nr:hypothetical protein [Bacteroidota bacterium]